MSKQATVSERAARAQLTWLAQPGDRLLGALTRAAGAERAMAIIRAGELPRDTGLAVTPDAWRAVRRWQAMLGKVPPRGEVEQALGWYRFLCPGDAGWPGGLDQLGDAAPLALWVTGTADLASSCCRAVAVTGARAATAYGSHLASELSASLAGQGRAVISGGSFGVDAAAHRGCLAADGVTIAVTAAGPGLPYPAGNAGLFGEIADRGAVASEAPPGTPPSRLRFQARSRIIAALATATVIIEASARSTAITTARHARDLGRPVMAVPGPVTSELSAGCHQLIRSGHAVLVTSASDIAAGLTVPAPRNG